LCIGYIAPRVRDSASENLQPIQSARAEHHLRAASSKHDRSGFADFTARARMMTALSLIPTMKFCFETHSFPTLSQLYLLSRSLHSSSTFALFPFFETLATNSSNLESKSFKMGDLFDFLWPRARSIVGASPLRGRLVKDEAKKVSA
jgi:hypothetical protein